MRVNLRFLSPQKKIRSSAPGRPRDHVTRGPQQRSSDGQVSEKIPLLHFR
jgi:hypothetical protein